MKRPKIKYTAPDLPERRDCEYNFLCVACFMGCYSLEKKKEECDRFISWNLKGYLDQGGKK